MQFSFQSEQIQNVYTSKFLKYNVDCIKDTSKWNIKVSNDHFESYVSGIKYIEIVNNIRVLGLHMRSLKAACSY